MKIFIVSDLHIEFSDFQPSVSSQDADVIVLAGDIWKSHLGIEWSRKQWPVQQIIYIAGNHEFYGQNRLSTISNMRVSARKNNVHFLENDEVVIDGVRFLGCTLWTDFKLFGESSQCKCMNEASRWMNDFTMIKENGKHFLPSNALSLFDESHAFLKSKLTEAYGGKTIVVTHHLPSKSSIAQKYQNDLLSACFASNIDDLFGYSDLWIHGHTHYSFDYTSKGTRVLCNPRGYSRFSQDIENFEFNPELQITL